MKDHQEVVDDVQVVCGPEEVEDFTTGILGGESVHDSADEDAENAGETSDGLPAPIVEIGQSMRSMKKTD